MSFIKSKGMFLSIFLILLLLPSIFAANSYGTEWGEYQNSPENLGHTGLEITDLSGNWNETDIVSVINDGADFQPLGFDVDNDDVVEIIGSDDNYIKIWSYSVVAGLHLDEEMNMGANQTVTMSAVGDYDNDGFTEFVGIFGNEVGVFGYNSVIIDVTYWYRFENDTTDEIGNQDGIEVNNPSYVASKGNKGTGTNAINFNGSNYVNLTDILDFERTDAFSVSLWFNASSTGVLIGKGLGGGTFQGWIIHVNPNGLLDFYLINNIGTNNYILSRIPIDYRDEIWHHLVITYDGSSTASGIEVYIDGVSKSPSIERDNLTGTIKNSVDAQISGREGANDLFNGSIDEVAIFNNTILTAQNVNNIYSGGIDVIRTFTFSKELNATIPNNQNATSGIKCLNISNERLCYFSTEDEIMEFNTSDGTITNYTIAFDINFTMDTEHSKETAPSSEDIDRDGFDELVFIWTNHSIGCAGFEKCGDGILVWDTNSKSLDTGFNGNGIKSMSTIGTSREPLIAGTLIYNTDRAGDKEIILTFYQSQHGTGNNVYMVVLNSAGNVAWSDTILQSTSSASDIYISPPVIRKAETDVRTQVCAIQVDDQSGSVNEQSIISCWKVDNGENNFYNSSGLFEGADDLYWKVGRPIIAANLDQLIMHELITGRVIINIGELVNYNKSSYLNITTIQGDVNSYPIAIDVNGDNVLDICAMRLGRTYCAFSTFTNNPPEINSSRTFRPNFISPLCLDTSVTFEAIEDTHYTNDFHNDEERLLSTCGIGATLINGSFNLDHPLFSCFYDTLGTYTFDIFLQDDSNEDDYTQSREFIYYVINGTAGVSCNLPVPTGIDVITPPLAAEDEVTTEEDIKEGVEMITAQSPFVKGLIVLILTVILILAMARFNITNPIIYAITIFCVWMGFAMIGLMSWIYVIIYALFGLGAGFVYFVKSRGE